MHNDLIHHMRTPRYKKQYLDGGSGYAVEMNSRPRPIGCAWVKFSYQAGEIDIQVEMEVI